MDTGRTAFDWNQARAFLAVAERGSLTAAARDLGLTQPTLGRQVRALEEDLGVALFERIGRGLQLTPAGVDLLDHVRAMAGAADRMALMASGQSRTLEGRITLTASEIYTAYLLPPVIARLRALHPGVEVDLVPSNAAVDLHRREADIAIRNFRPTQPDLICRKIRDDTARFYATPAYLQRIGAPETLADLETADFIGFDAGDAMIAGLAGLGLTVTERNFPIRAGNHLVHWELTKLGLGIGVMPERIGDAEPSVRRVLPGFDAMIYPVWLTSHRDLKTSRRVRVVFDLLAEALAAG